MRLKMIMTIFAAAALAAALTVSFAAAPAQAGELTGTAKKELEAIKKIFEIEPRFAIDKTEASGTYCMNVGFGRGGHMTHYSTTPKTSINDIIDFIDARPLIEAGLVASKLPAPPKEAGNLKPGQWYFLAAGAHEPFHGHKFPMPLLIKAADVK